jgi:hypothetical protein
LWLDGVLFVYKMINNKTTSSKNGDTMAIKTVQDYFDDTDEGHIYTREANFQCDHPDMHLRSDLGIDVMG